MGLAWLIVALVLHGPQVFAGELYGVKDASDRQELERFSPHTPWHASDHIDLLFESSQEGEAIVVMRNGTETFHLPDSVSATWLAWKAKRKPQPQGQNSGSHERQEESTLWKTLWSSREQILEWTQWPTGFAFDVKTKMNALPDSKPTSERQLGWTWSQSIFRWGFVEAGLHRSQWGGGVTLPLRPGEVDFFTNVESPPSYWDEADWWWQFAIGGPGIQFAMRSQAGIAPPYLFLDRKAPTQAKRYQSGTVLNWFEDDKSHEGNTSQALNLRFSHLRYSFIWDGDAYQVPIMHLSLEDLPFQFGHIHFGAWSANQVVMTEIGLDLMPKPLVLPGPSSWASQLTVMPLRLNFLFYDKKQFQFSLCTRIHIDNRIFRLPGGAP
jgi:hypothetical protein